MFTAAYRPAGHSAACRTTGILDPPRLWCLPHPAGTKYRNRGTAFHQAHRQQSSKSGEPRAEFLCWFAPCRSEGLPVTAAEAVVQVVDAHSTAAKLADLELRYD